MAADVVIAGGGPAGAAAAIRLARAGARVTLLERTRAMHDKVCGEFLGPVALQEVAELGIDVSSLGAMPIARVTLVNGARRVEASLSFAAQALSRAILDEALLYHAAAAGVDVRRGVTARPETLERERSALFVATGKHDLHGRARATEGFLGFKQHLQLGPATRGALGGRIVLMPLAGGYAGLQPLADGLATFCLALSPGAFAAAGGTWPKLVEAVRRAQPQLDGWLADARPVQTKPLAVGRIPYGFVRRETERAYWLGDQAAVIPSFAGAGIGMALVSGRMAADAYLHGDPASQFQKRYAAFAGPQVRRAHLLSYFLTRPRWAAGAAATMSHAPMLLDSLALALHSRRGPTPEPAMQSSGFLLQGSVEA